MAELPSDWMGNPDGTPRIVEAAGQLSGRGGLGPSRGALTAAVEKAMADAVLAAIAEGLSLANEEHCTIIRQRQLDARQAVLDGEA